uniref:Uncharacterized protein n=1 Tax=Glossina palpalis gambiensis TaxID=67801 RepID=A0A1B0AMW4_9MUSC
MRDVSLIKANDAFCKTKHSSSHSNITRAIKSTNITTTTTTSKTTTALVPMALYMESTERHGQVERTLTNRARNPHQLNAFELATVAKVHFLMDSVNPGLLNNQPEGNHLN